MPPALRLFLTQAGVSMLNGAQYNTVGGTTAGAANVISGNTLGGAGFVYAGTSYNVIEGNLIGLNAAGTAAIGNGLTGAFAIDGASNDTIGGTTSAVRNVISGNTTLA